MNFALQNVPLPLRFRPFSPMTDDELLRFCVANEVLRVEREANGDVLVMTPAGNRTGKRNTAIISALDVWAQADGRGYAFDSNTGFTLADGSMRSPDAAWVLAARWDALSEEEQNRFSPICPEFVVELRSESDRLPDVETKMEQWIANGAMVAWLVDPEAKTVVVYREGALPERLLRPTTVIGDGPVAGFELGMGRIWS
jgi:Uma2 family endonuclease